MVEINNGVNVEDSTDVNVDFGVALRTVRQVHDGEDQGIIDTSVFWRICLVQKSGAKTEEPGGNLKLTKNTCQVRLCHIHTGLYLAIKDTDNEAPDVYLTREYMDMATVLSVEGTWRMRRPD